MPPSGYATNQTRLIGEFLYSCARELESEARENKTTLRSALVKEIASISEYLSQRHTSQAQTGTLNLTAAFYSQLLAQEPDSDEAFWDAVAEASHAILLEIDNIEIIT